MILEDGTKILLEVGRCYGAFDYGSFDMYIDNRQEHDGIWSAKWGERREGSPDTELYLHLEGFVNAQLKLKELSVNEYVRNLKIWANVSIENPVVLPQSLEFAYLSINAVYSNLVDFAHTDTDIVICSDDSIILNDCHLLSYNKISEEFTHTEW